jgi:hypothetical protein
MKLFRVIKGPATFGPGQDMELEPKQVEIRKHNLKLDSLDPRTGRVMVQAVNAVEFKAGEVIGLPALDRRLEQIMEPVDKPASPAPEAAKDQPAAASASGSHTKRHPPKASS